MGSKRRKLSSGSYQAVSAEDAPEANGDPSKPTQDPDHDQRRSLFVRSLPASVTTERLAEYFSESFPLKHATVVTDPKTKTSKGFGFVTFADAEDAHAALQQFNDSVLDGRKIKVEIAEARHRDAEDGGKSGPNTTAAQLREKREKDRTAALPPKLIVRNLPWSISTPEELSALFRSYGKVKHAVVPKRGPKGQYGFGIVAIRGKKNAEKALEGVNGKEVDGRTLAVDWAVDKETWLEMQQTEKQSNTKDKSSKSADPASPSQDKGLDNDPQAKASEIPDTNNEDGASDATSSDADSTPDDNSAAESDDEDLTAETDLDSETEAQPESSNDTTVFIRNLPFTVDDDALREYFNTFGPVRYARVVYDRETERSRGTGFVCFFNLEDAKTCVKNAPKHEVAPAFANNEKKRKGELIRHSVLENPATDPSGQYTFEGRVLQVSRALSKTDAEQRANEASEQRDIRDRDKRRLYLLSEGTVPKGSKLYEKLGKAEMDIRESSARQRQKLLKTNPNLCLSLTRLSVRNVPRSIGSKELKALARDAVVGFAKDVKAGLRERLSKEEVSRGGDEMKEADRLRKMQGKGIVRQAKVVFEDKEGGKVGEGAGRSRGYGFIEYVSHRNALMGLRWLNGHAVKSQGGGEGGKRLIVEFAIENVQVLQRRTDREHKARANGPKTAREGKGKNVKPGGKEKEDRGKKRKRQANDEQPSKGDEPAAPAADQEDKNRIAKRNRIIAKKRQARRTRKG